MARNPSRISRIPPSQDSATSRVIKECNECYFTLKTGPNFGVDYRFTGRRPHPDFRTEDKLGAFKRAGRSPI